MSESMKDRFEEMTKLDTVPKLLAFSKTIDVERLKTSFRHMATHNRGALGIHEWMDLLSAIGLVSDLQKIALAQPPTDTGPA